MNRKYILYTQLPKPKKKGVEGLLSVDHNGRALFLSPDGESALCEMAKIRLERAGDHLLLSGFEFLKVDSSGNRIYRYQEWVLKYV